jgi:uncharacterized delta-60 repeat protein
MRMLPTGLRMCCMAFVCAAVLCHGQVQQSWVRRYAGRGGSQHLSAGPVLSSNVVYVAGEVEDGAGGDAQMVLVGYGQETTAYVEALHNPGTNQTDTAGALEILPDGNLIMVGTSASDLNTALVVAKLAPNGTQIWSRRFDAANFDPEQPVLAAFDPAGNIYIAGTTLASPSDVITIKYSPDGQQQWATPFTGLSAGAADDGVALKADPAGNVYLSGNSRTGSELDLFTVKYGPNGNPVWARRYGGPLRQQENAGGLVVDGQGNVYISGASVGQTGSGVIRYELALVKYGANGNELWTARYGLSGDISEVQRAIAVDPEGNVLVLVNVHSGGDNDWLLLKFDPDGNRLWTARYNGVEDGYDNGYALAVDEDGNAYVAGASDDPVAWRFVTAKYDRFGNRRWAATFDADGIFDFPVGIAAGRTGDVYLAGQSGSFTGSGGFLTIRYSQPGSAPPGWPEILTPPSSQTAPGGSNVTFSVSASGSALTYQWRYNGKRIPDATTSSLTLGGVALEQSGQYSVEVSNSQGSVASPEADLLVLIPPLITEQPRDQFAYAGTEVTFTASAYGTEPFQFQWFRDQTPLSNGLSRILTLRNVQVSDTAEYRAVVSNISGAATSAVARLTVSPLVQQQWANLYDGPGHDAEANPIVKVDGAGNVYVGGTSPGTNNADFVVIKYHPAGARLWTARYSAARETTEALFAMEVDATGTVWATGTTATDGAERNAVTVSFAADGALRWAQRFGASNSFSAGFALAVDAAGNCYVAGQSDEDFLTLKYDAAGAEQWARVFNGAGDGVDTARAIAVSDTDIYVTGSSWNGSNLDFLTLKYGDEGGLRWRAIYDAAETDNAVAVATDPWGDVVVTGNSYGTINYDEYGSDYLVVKYSPEGARLWTARYDGFMNAEDYPSALAVDAAGNIYVTGASDYESPDSGVRQFATLKYAPDGRELWRSWHIGQQNDGSRSIAVDANDNVYITSLATGSFSGRDIGLIKYDALGTRLLTARYSGIGNADDLPSTLALGPGGEIYVTGLTAGSLDGVDFVLIKYGQNDVPGLPAILESPRNVDVARGGNAFFGVTATGEPPLSYQWFFNDDEIDGATASTLEIQSAQFADAGSYSVRVGNVHGSVLSASAVLVVQAPPSILVPPQSQMVVAGSTASLSVTADGSGPFGYQWVFNDAPIWNATNRQLAVPNIHLTNAGNYAVIVSNRVGFAQSAAARLRVTSMAEQRWDARVPGFDSGGVPVAMAAGPDGSIHVASAVGSGDSTDLSVTKFDAYGGQVWSARYNGPGDSFDVATDIVVDREGNVYVTGDSWGGESLVDAATIKFDRDGNQAWVARFNGPNNSEDIAHALAVDTNGNVAVAISSGSSANNVDYMTVCYNALGTQKWVAVYDGPAHSFDEPADIAFDSTGQVYVTGSSTVSGLNTDLATVKYNTNGVELWRSTYRAAGTVGAVAVRLGVDAADSVYVAGWSSDSNHVADYAIVRYLSGGQQAWSARYDGLSRGYDYLSDLIVDPAGNCYVTGSSHTSTEGADWITLKLNPNGQRVWLATFGGRFGVGDSLPVMAFDASGNICLAGSLYTGESFATATARYDTNGNRVWTATYGADTPANEFAEAIATDRDGNVFVGGTSYFSDAFESFVVKYAQADVPGAPVITRPPASNVVMAEAATRFTVSAEGDGVLSYQWLRGHFPVGQGGASTNLVISNAGDALAGYYSVEVQNDVGTVVSPAAELRVAGPSVPRLSATVSDGVLRLVVLAEGEFNYRIEASSDLRDWEIVTITYNQYSSIVITEPLSATYRYYRAVKLP